MTRGPGGRHPALDLRSAVDRLRRLAEVAPGGTADAGATAAALGYGGKGGRALAATSALVAFGLLEPRGAGHAPTTLGLRALAPSTPDALEARREAFRRPAAHVALLALARDAIDRDGGGAPGHGGMARALLDLGLRPRDVARAIADYRAGLAWVGRAEVAATGGGGVAPTPAGAPPPVPADPHVVVRTTGPVPIDLVRRVARTFVVDRPGARDDGGALDGRVVLYRTGVGTAGGGPDVVVETTGPMPSPAVSDAVAGWLEGTDAADGGDVTASGVVARCPTVPVVAEPGGGEDDDPYAGLRPHPVTDEELLLAGVWGVEDLVARVNAARDRAGRPRVSREEFPVRRSQFRDLVAQLVGVGG